MRQNTIPVSRTLNSWKEIASYLDRGVRTVQRWERELQLPVHRIGTGKRSPVYATITELNFWMSTAGIVRTERNPAARLLEFPNRPGGAVQDSRRLLTDMHNLARTLAEASVRQHRAAELLQKTINRIKLRIK